MWPGSLSFAYLQPLKARHNPEQNPKSPLPVPRSLGHAVMGPQGHIQQKPPELGLPVCTWTHGAVSASTGPQRSSHSTAQRSAQELPLVEKQSTASCPAQGGKRMVLSGHNFLQDSKVVFVEKAPGTAGWSVGRREGLHLPRHKQAAVPGAGSARAATDLKQGPPQEAKA